MATMQIQTQDKIQNPQNQIKQNDFLKFNTALSNFLGPLGRQAVPYGMEVRYSVNNGAYAFRFEKVGVHPSVYQKALIGKHPMEDGTMKDTHVSGCGRGTL